MKKLFTSIFTTFFTASILAAEVPPVPEELKGKTINYVVAYAPGGDTDAIQRTILKKVEELSGLKFLVLNRPGAASIIASKEVASSKADGTTLLGVDNAVIFNSGMNVPQSIDPATLSPIAIHAFTPHFLYVKSDSAINDIKSLVQYAKENKSFSVGCNAPFICAYMKQLFDEYGKLSYVPNFIPFKSPPEMGIAVTQDQLTVFGVGATAGLPMVQANKIKPIANGWINVLPVFPTVQPIDRTFKGFIAHNMQMTYAPSGTPKHIIEYYNTVFRAAAMTDEFTQMAVRLSFVTKSLNLQELDKVVKEQSVWAIKLGKYTIN